MENASKALLIAAAVLVVILIIAFGMRIFRSTGDTAGQVESLGAEITQKTSSVSEAIYTDIYGVSQQIKNDENILKGYKVGDEFTHNEFHDLLDRINRINKNDSQHKITLGGHSEIIMKDGEYAWNGGGRSWIISSLTRYNTGEVKSIIANTK